MSRDDTTLALACRVLFQVRVLTLPSFICALSPLEATHGCMSCCDIPKCRILALCTASYKDTPNRHGGFHPLEHVAGVSNVLVTQGLDGGARQHLTRCCVYAFQ